MNTSISINKIGIGTAQFGLDYGISNKSGKVPTTEVSIILDYAKSVGIDTIDTAIAYGESEEVLGKNSLNEFKVISKFLPLDNTKSIEAQINESLRRMNIDKLYGFIAHRTECILSNKVLWKELQGLKNSKLVDKVGFSINAPKEIDQCLHMGFVPDLIQIPNNYLDNRYLGYMKELKSVGCEIHTRSVFLQGLFFKPIDELPDFFDEVKPIISRLQMLGNKLPLLLLKHSLENSLIDRVIIGIENKKQLMHNLQAINNEGSLPKINQKIPEKILTPSIWPEII